MKKKKNNDISVDARAFEAIAQGIGINGKGIKIGRYKGFKIRVVKFDHTFNRFKELQMINKQLWTKEAEDLIESLRDKVLFLAVAENDDCSVRFHHMAGSYRQAGKQIEMYIDNFAKSIQKS